MMDTLTLEVLRRELINLRNSRELVGRSGRSTSSTGDSERIVEADRGSR